MQRLVVILERQCVFIQFSVSFCRPQTPCLFRGLRHRAPASVSLILYGALCFHPSTSTLKIFEENNYGRKKFRERIMDFFFGKLILWKRIMEFFFGKLILWKRTVPQISLSMVNRFPLASFMNFSDVISNAFLLRCAAIL